MFRLSFQVFKDVKLTSNIFIRKDDLRFFKSKRAFIRKDSKKKDCGVYIEEIDSPERKYVDGSGTKITVKKGLGKALRSLGVTPKQFLQENPLQSEDEDEGLDEDTHEVLENVEDYYDMHAEEQEARKEFIQRKIYERKYFHEPPETNLLTAAAKEQIRYLHGLDPIKWDAEALSQTFPISEDGVTKLLRSRFCSYSPSRRLKHDQSVARNIKLLKKDSEVISFKTTKLWKEGKLNIENSSGVADLPSPPTDFNTSELKQLQARQPQKAGEFLSIVKPYLDLKAKQSTASKSMETVAKNDQFHHTVKPGNGDELDDPFCATYYDPRLKNQEIEPEITCTQLQQNIQNSGKTLEYNIDDETSNQFSKMEEELETASTPTMNYVKKYEEDAVEFVIGDQNDENSKGQFYTYDSELGYQHSLGKAQEYQDKINIPANKYKSGATYRVGNCYYDENGDFLYRTFS